MNIDIQSKGFQLTPSLRSFLGRRLAGHLAHETGRIGRILVRMSDVNGPRGGDDKRCLIELRLKRGGSIVIDDIRTDMYEAIDQAVRRAARSLTRRHRRIRGLAPGRIAAEIPIG